MKTRHSPAQSWIQPTPPLAVLNFKIDDVPYTERIITDPRSQQAAAPTSPLCPGAGPSPPSPGRAAPGLSDRHLTPSAPRGQGPGFPLPRCFSPCSRPAPCKTNPNYPCCSALRIEAEFAARAAHLPAPAAPRHSSVTRRWWHHQPGWAGPATAERWRWTLPLPRLSDFRADRSRQRQILQLLQLAQAASNRLKPQPFFYERRAPDMRPIDLRSLQWQPGLRKGTLPSSADNGAYLQPYFQACETLLSHLHLLMQK